MINAESGANQGSCGLDSYITFLTLEFGLNLDAMDANERARDHVMRRDARDEKSVGLDQQTGCVDSILGPARLFPHLPSPIAHRPPNPCPFSSMPRKAAASTEESGETAAPRRSSRIKDQPKAEPAPKKAPAKPRAKKADKEAAPKEDKPKSAKGTKRKAEDAAEGGAEGEEAPASKKVRFFSSFSCK